MSEKTNWNKQVEHPLQAWEWGEFREKTGAEVVRERGIQVTLHKIPYTKWKIGYGPKIARLDKTVISTLEKIAKENNCIFIKVEPKIEAHELKLTQEEIVRWKLVQGRALFTKYNFVLDVTPSEEQLLAQMKQKTRYNIKVAAKRGVTVQVDNSQLAFEKYLELTQETTQRQKFYAHNPEYHRKMWEIMHGAGIAELITAKYQGEIITTWVLFKFKDTLYYPYGASSREHKEVMANNLVMWEAIRLAKRSGCKYLDMWGALGPDPDPKDPWLGFHNFKLGYDGRHVEYIGTWDYVAWPTFYKIYRMVEVIRWKILRLIK